MNLKATLLGLTTIAGLGLSAGIAFAAAESLPGEVTADRVIAAYSATYDRVEVRVSPSQIKVEAFDLETMEKIEVIYDRTDGTSPLSVETRTARHAPMGDDATGTEVKSTTGDFVDDDGEDDGHRHGRNHAEDDGSDDDEDGTDDDSADDSDDDSADDDSSDDHSASSDDDGDRHGRGRGRGRGGDRGGDDNDDNDDDSDSDEGDDD